MRVQGMRTSNTAGCYYIISLRVGAFRCAHSALGSPHRDATQVIISELFYTCISSIQFKAEVSRFEFTCQSSLQLEEGCYDEYYYNKHNLVTKSGKIHS